MYTIKDLFRADPHAEIMREGTLVESDPESPRFQVDTDTWITLREGDDIIILAPEDQESLLGILRGLRHTRQKALDKANQELRTASLETD